MKAASFGMLFSCIVLLLLCCSAKLRDPFRFDYVRYPGEVYTVVGIGRIRPTDEYFAVIRVRYRHYYLSIGDTFGLYTVKEIFSRTVVLEDAQKKCRILHLQGSSVNTLAINSA